MKRNITILLLALWTICSSAQIQNDTICQGDSLLFHGKYYSVSGTYADTVRVIDHIDSVAIEPDTFRLDTFYRDSTTNILILTVMPTIHYQQVNLCDGDTFYFKGISYSEQSIAYDTFYSRSGCDSIIKLFINFHAPVLIKKSASICKGDYFPLGNRRLTESGIYRDSLKTSHGCDSIIELTLSVFESFYEEIYDTICSGMSYKWCDSTYTTSCSQSIRLLNSHGCDSIHTLHLTVLPYIQINVFDTLCNGDTCHFCGKDFTSPGKYDITILNPGGCDTTYTLYLTVNNHVHLNLAETICENDFFPWAGKNYNIANTYYDTLPGQNGECDTFSVLKLSVLPVPRTNLTHSICAESSFYFRDKLIDKPGIYYDTLVAFNGCDSIVRLVVNLNPSYIYQDTSYICEGDSIDFYGEIITNAGTYTAYLKTKDDCDSIIEKTVVVNKNDTVNLTVNRCDHLPYDFFGQLIYLPGTYQKSLATKQGCDSLIILHFDTVPYFDEEYAIICEGETYDFHGSTVATQGTHYVSHKGRYGCDSTFKLNLTVGRRYEFITDTAVCSGTHFLWRGKQYVTSGTYHDPFATYLGCDSIYTLNITFLDKPYTPKIVNFCQGDSLFFNGKVIKHSMNIDDTLRSITGCDSIVQYRFNMVPSFHHSDTVDICVGSSYKWHGQTINRSGIYWDSLKTINGCDSIFELTVRSVNSQTIPISATICEGEYYTFNGKRLYTSGTYYDTIYNSQGCADILILDLTVTPTYLQTVNITLCPNESFWYKGIFVNKVGIYYDSLRTADGCDSVCRLIFNWSNTYLFEDTAVICKGNSYMFHGRPLTNDGIYYDSLKTQNGCDSIYKLRLVVKLTITVDSSKTTNIHADICSNDIYYRPDGSIINKTGLYIDTLVTTAGCDSIVKLALNVHADKFYEESKTICKGNYYPWHGRKLTSSGVYWDSLVTTAGCDSVFKLTLTNNTYYTEIDTTLCDNSAFRFNNRIYTSSGVYYDTLMTVLSCDSVFKINLTINPTYNIVRHITICDTDFPIPFAGGFVHQTGVYHDTTTTLQGCDSINTLYLTVVQTYYFMEDTICEDEIYTWRGHQYTQPGIYTDTVADQTEAQCDIIYALRLHTVQKTNFYGLDIAPYICADDMEYAITPRYTGTKPDAYTIRYSSAEISKQSDIVNANFATSPIMLPLPLSVDGDSLRPDTYSGTIELYNRVCDANPMSLDFTINIRYPSFIVVQHWNDVVAILNSKYNGGYTFSKYDWYVNNILIESITGSNMFLPNLRTGDKVEVGLTREGESYAVLTCPIWMQDLSNLEVSEYPVAIEGTILRNNTQARIIASAAGTYSLYSAAGLLITSGTFEKNSETLVELPAVSGIYFLKVTTNNEPRTFKLLVQ